MLPPKPYSHAVGSAAAKFLGGPQFSLSLSAVLVQPAYFWLGSTM